MSATKKAALGLLLLIAIAPFLLPFALPRLPGERILRFHSDITVREDGSLRVVETITVRATGEQIKRGIYRDFPTEYRDQDGRGTSVTFQVLGVLRSGQPESHRVVSQANGKRVYIGREDVFLPPGQYTYQLTYVTDRQIGEFSGYRELYWNVTGTGWVFPIDGASAIVQLPPAAADAGVLLRAYTGRQGARETYARYGVRHDAIAQFETTRPLSWQQGLTIVAAWPRPSMTQTGLLAWVREQPLQALAGLGLLALVLYYLGIWLLVGKDPVPGPITLLAEPPADLSPAAMRFLRKMGSDDRGFAAALVDLAVQGALQIEQQDGLYTLRRLGHADGALAPEAAQAAAELFGGASGVRLTSDNHQRVSGARAVLQTALEQRYGKGYFRRNGGAFWRGILLSAPLIVALATLAGAQHGRWWGESVVLWSVLFVALMPVVFGALLFLLVVTFRRWKAALVGRSGRLGAACEALLLSIFTVVALGFGSVGLHALGIVTSEWVVATWAALMAVHVVFFDIMPAYTPAGRALLDRIEGFRHYLSTAAIDSLQLLNPPGRTPALFERQLPYALALDVEGAWGEQFNDLLSHGPGSAGYRPHWYDGSFWGRDGAAEFACTMGETLSGAISASSTPPGSSSGSSDGGGSSGGGGGGGGGGGW